VYEKQTVLMQMNADKHKKVRVTLKQLQKINYYTDDGNDS